MLQLILTVVLAIGVSAFCSVSEAALYSMSWSTIEDLRRKGRRSGEVIFALRQDIERPITTILTLNTAAGIAGAAVAGTMASDFLGPEFLPVFTVAFTLLVLIFGEIIPKTVGVVYARSVTPYLAGPLQWLVVALSPLTFVLNLLTRFIRRRRAAPQATEDDIRAMVSLTLKAGLIKPYEEVAIRNILSLDLKTVEQVMTPRTVVFSLSAHMTVAEAQGVDGFWTHSRVPVYDGDDREQIVGLAYRRDVMRAVAGDQFDVPLGRIMKPVEFVLDTTPLDHLLLHFLESRIHLFVVLDEYGGLAGVITLEDILEEILGKEIVDETDQVADLRALARKRREDLVRTAGQRPAEKATSSRR